MFKINDVIVYGSEGVCQITGVEEIMFGGTSTEYYVMKPMDGRKTTFYIPTGNQALLAKMRKPLSKKEIDDFFAALGDMDPIWIENDNERKIAYGKILADGDRQDLMRMIKALHLQKQEREAVGKHLRMWDERVMKDAERILYNEWQYVLEMDRDRLTAYIHDRIEKG